MFVFGLQSNSASQKLAKVAALRVLTIVYFDIFSAMPYPLAPNPFPMVLAWWVVMLFLF